MFYPRVFSHISRDQVKRPKIALQFGPIGGTFSSFWSLEYEDELLSVVTPIWFILLDCNVNFSKSAFSRNTP